MGTAMKKELNKKELEASNIYWFENFSQKSNQVDKLCTHAAERLGEIDFEIWRYDRGDINDAVATSFAGWRGEKVALEHILRHFHGFIDVGFLIANDTGRENIERNKTRAERDGNSYPRGNVDFGTSME